MDTNTANVVIGKKQILRLAKERKLQSVQMATNVDEAYAKSILATAKENDIAVVFQNTMEEIAKQYGIDVPCGAVGFLK